VITRKEKPLTPNLRAIRRLAREVSQAKVSRLILVHGGGSYGHPLAKQYGIGGGYRDPSQIMGFSRTHQAMVALNRLVVDALIRRDVPAVAVQPSSCVLTKSSRIHVMEERPLRRLLEVGFVPVLYGDAVIDSDTGFSILSGDQLVSYFALRLGADRVVMGIDVDGLYTADPKTDSSARLIPHVVLEELKRLRHRIEEAKVVDVTGGMLGKVLELIPTVERGIPVIIVNAAKPGNIYKALKGERVVGTIIEKGEAIA